MKLKQIKRLNLIDEKLRAAPSFSFEFKKEKKNNMILLFVRSGQARTFNEMINLAANYTFQ